MSNQEPEVLALKYKERIEEVTPELIAQWKAKHGEVYEMAVYVPKVGYVPVEGDTGLDAYEKHTFYLCAPDRYVMSTAEKMSRLFTHKFYEVIIANCLLNGKREAIDDEFIFRSLSTQIDQIITYYVAEVKKL